MVESQMLNRFTVPKIMGLTHILWQFLLFGIPLFFLGLLSFRTYEMGLPVGKLTLANYQKLLEEPLLYKSLVNTIVIGITVSLISTLLALIAIIRVWEFKSPIMRNIIFFACAIVFFIGLIPRTFVFQYLLSEQGPLSVGWKSLGWGTFPFQLYTFGGLVLGYLPVFVPLSVLILFIARKEILQEYVHVAKELGSSNFTIQYEIILPLMKTSIFISLILIFLLTIADVVIIVLIGGTKLYSVSSLIIDYIKIDDWGMAASASFIFLFFILIFLYLVSKTFLKRMS